MGMGWGEEEDPVVAMGMEWGDVLLWLPCIL